MRKGILFFLVTVSCSKLWAGNLIKLNHQTLNTGTSSVASENKLTQAGLVILQLKRSFTEEDKAWLKKLNVEVFGYLPDDAFVIRTQTASQHKAILEQDFVQALLPYRPEWKLANELRSLQVENYATRAYQLQLLSIEDLSSVQKYIQALPDARLVTVDGRIITAVLSAQQVLELANLETVEHIQLLTQFRTWNMSFTDMGYDGEVSATELRGDYTDLTGFETGTKVMNLDSAWLAGWTGSGIIAAMADTGLDVGDTPMLSPDFKGTIKSGQALGLFSKSWEDPMGHGTHVAGSIMGRGTFSNGALKGAAYNSQIVAQSMWSPMMKGLSPPKISELLSKAYAEGARIHSNSWGSPNSLGVYDNNAAQVDSFAFDNDDMLVIFAAGNSGVDKNKDGRIDSGSVSTPGTAKNALTVGASENLLNDGGIQVPVSKLRSSKDSWSAEPIFSSRISDNINGLAMFSSRGPTNDGRLKPEIVAPGTNILSARSHALGAEDMWGRYNENYVYSGGTSMATPLTAGAAAVVREALIKNNSLANPSAAIIKATLLHTARDMFPGQYGAVGASLGQELLTPRPNADQGFGRVDMAAFTSLKQRILHLSDDRAGVKQGVTNSTKIRLSQPGKLVATLLWMDAAASANAAQTLVNDLDLQIVGPQGTASAQGRINNQEFLELANAPAGEYSVQVSGFKIPQGKQGRQPYALIVTVE